MRRSIGRSSGPVVRSSLNEATNALVALAALAPDSLHECEVLLDGERESLILYCDVQGAVRAWRNVCPHAGRRLDYAPGQFLRSKQGELICAVHGASFELAAGRCVGGPCRGDCLRAVDVHVADGQVRLGAAG